MNSRPVCALCGRQVFSKGSAWISHRYGATIHMDCIDKDWSSYRRLLERNTA